MEAVATWLLSLVKYREVIFMRLKFNFICIEEGRFYSNVSLYEILYCWYDTLDMCKYGKCLSKRFDACNIHILEGIEF